MKKSIAAILIFFCAVSALSAQLAFSAGGGGMYRVDTNSMTLTNIGNKEKESPFSDSLPFANSHLGGFFAFFDAVYAEADVCLLFSNQSDGDTTFSVTGLQFGLLGKFPIDIGGFTVFPLAGFQLFIPMSFKSKAINSNGYTDTYNWGSPYSRFNMSQFWLRVGAGADLNISGKIFIRPSFLWGFRFKNKDESNMAKTAKANGDKMGFFNHGFEFRLTAGYRF